MILYILFLSLSFVKLYCRDEIFVRPDIAQRVILRKTTKIVALKSKISSYIRSSNNGPIQAYKIYFASKLIENKNCEQLITYITKKITALRQELPIIKYPIGDLRQAQKIIILREAQNMLKTEIKLIKMQLNSWSDNIIIQEEELKQILQNLVAMQTYMHIMVNPDNCCFLITGSIELVAFVKKLLLCSGYNLCERN